MIAVVDSKDKVTFNFNKMIRAYVRLFARTDPKEVLPYFCVVRDQEFKCVLSHLLRRLLGRSLSYLFVMTNSVSVCLCVSQDG